jgi:hypothetical protein
MTLLNEFDAPALKNLNLLVKDGGFAKERPDKGDKVKPECLGKLLKDGCGGSVAELKKLCGALDKTSRKNLKGLMEEGYLGQEPEVLSKLYGLGCDKNPTDLVRLCKAFDGSNADSKPERMKQLITKGGFGGQAGEKKDALAKVFKDGLDKRPDRLKTLYKAFTNNGASVADLKNLKTTIDAINKDSSFTDPAKRSEPGKRMKDVLKVIGAEHDPAKFKTPFFDNLRAATTSDTRLGYLIENAATMSCKGWGEATGEVPSGPDLVAVNVPRMDHYCDRHTREFQAFDLKTEGSSAADVGLWPEDTTETDVANYCSLAVSKWRQRFGGKPTWANVRSQIVNYPTKKFTSANLDINTKHGVVTVRLGFELDKPTTGKVWISQFFPYTGSGNVVAVTNDEAHAIQRALNK